MKNILRKFILNWVINAGAIALASYYIATFSYNGSWLGLALTALIFSLVTVLLKPILKILSIPLFFLGPILFFLADGAVLWGISNFGLVESFQTGDWLSLGLATFIIAIVNYIAHWIV